MTAFSQRPNWNNISIQLNSAIKGKCVTIGHVSSIYMMAAAVVAYSMAVLLNMNTMWVMPNFALVPLRSYQLIVLEFCKFGVHTNEPRHDKTNKVRVRPAKTQISQGIRPVWSEFSLCTYWVAKDPSFLHADNKDSDQTGQMPRLIWVFAGRSIILLVLSCRSSNLKRKFTVVYCFTLCNDPVRLLFGTANSIHRF